jgi:hypothetical protein
MIVEPDLTNHPKFIQLKSQVGDVAMELLVRLWTHCQQNKRGQFWRGANSDYVEVVCAGRSRRGKLFTALRDCQWIHERPDGIEVHDWDKHNASLIARWKRDVKPAQTPTQPATQTPVQPPDRTGQDMTGKDTRGEDGSINNNCGQMTPTLEEAVAWFQKNGSVYTADQVKAAFDSLEATKDPGGWWKFGQGRVTDWRSALSSRLALFSDKKNARGANGHPVGWEAGDADVWWTDSLVDVRAAMNGAALGNDEKTVARLRAILDLREKGAR